MDYKKLLPVNLILCVVLILFLLFYVYVYPKKKPPYLLVLILISLLPIVSVFRSGTYQSGDFSLHVIKTMAFYDALKDGNLFPSWAENLNATYGYPLFIFTYPLPYYLTSLFHFLGFSFITSVKLLLSFSFITSGITIFLFLENLLNKRSAFFGSLLYLFAPYHLVDLHFRADIGEVLAFVWMPLILFFTTRYEKTKKLPLLIFTSFSLTALILSHQAVSISFMAFYSSYVIIYYFFIRKSITDGMSLLGCILLGLLLSVFYLLPIFSYIPITYTKVTTIVFPKTIDFFISFWRYGLLFQGNKGELSSIIGYIHWISILFAIFLVLKKSIKGNFRSLLIIYLLSFFITFFFMQEISKSLWYIIPVIKNFQFSTRLLALESFLTAAIGGIVIGNIKSKKIFLFVSTLTVLITVLNWGNRQTIPMINDITLRTELPISTATMGEGLDPAAPLWVNPKQIWMKVVPPTHLEIISGSAQVSSFQRSSTQHIYYIKAETPVIFKENTLYFPGWHIFAGSKMIPVKYMNRSYPGIIMGKLPNGSTILTVEFKKTIVQEIGMVISCIAFIFAVFTLFFYYRKKFPKVFHINRS